MEIDTIKTAHADILSWLPDCERTGARTIAFVAPDAATMYRALMAVIYLGAAA
jgi:D-aminopeptidase